jgi:hypothetical protein
MRHRIAYWLVAGMTALILLGAVLVALVQSG